MKFSVLIPLYNKARYIEGTIKSVLAQTCADFELLVIDDGSNDGGADIVAAFDDPRLRLIRKTNSGVSVTRNLGIELALGEWVAFLDADDWHHPKYLESLLLAQKKFPQADTLGTDFIKLPDLPGEWPPHWAALEAEPNFDLITDLPLRWMDGPTLCTSSTAVRARRLKTMQPCFAPGESDGEDLDLFFRVAELAPVALIRSPLVAHRVEVQGSLSSLLPPLSMSPYVYRMRIRASSGQMAAPQRRSALWLVAQHEVSVARQALASGNRVEGMRWLLRGKRAAIGKRWWVTAAMVFLFPASLVQYWQHWRVRRTEHSLPVSLGSEK
jgi:glycosyltransferase involved in cell wall biosynthesis